jgi:hypothetical protein
MGASDVPASVGATDIAARREQRQRDVMRQYMAALLLLIGVAFLGATYAGEVARAAVRKHHADEKQRPTPQMMAPRPSPSESSRVSFGMIEPNYVGTGWAKN